jgi:hypothetical protein
MLPIIAKWIIQTDKSLITDYTDYTVAVTPGIHYQYDS